MYGASGFASEHYRFVSKGCRCSTFFSWPSCVKCRFLTSIDVIIQQSLAFLLEVRRLVIVNKI